MTKVTRREFIRDGVAAFTVSFAAPAFLSDIALAQGSRSRNLVVVYLSGGNDALSTVIPYQDPFYSAAVRRSPFRRDRCCRLAATAAARRSGLHPRLTGLRQIFNEGRLAIVQRTGYANSSRSHFQGTDIWGTADPSSPTSVGWLGRYLDTLPPPVDPLAAWNAARDTAARADGANRCRADDSRRARLRAVEPEQCGRGAQRARRRHPDGVVCAVGPPAPVVRQRLAARRARHARSRGVGEHLRAVAHVSEQRLCAGAAHGRRIDRARHRHARLLGADRRLRHALEPGQCGRRRLRDPDGHLQRRPARVLQRPAQPGAAQRHAGAAVLRVRPPHQRKRQPGHRPRRGRRDDGDGRRGPRRHLRHRARRSIRIPRTRRSRTTAAT